MKPEAIVGTNTDQEIGTPLRIHPAIIAHFLSACSHAGFDTMCSLPLLPRWKSADSLSMRPGREDVKIISLMGRLVGRIESAAGHY